MKEKKKEGKKKEKRYFADWYDSFKNSPSGAFLGAAMVLIPIIICIIISCNIGMDKYGNELNSYSSETYKYLEKIATLTIKEGYIDDSLLPDDVAEYYIHYNKSKEKTTVYTYSLDVTGDMQFTPIPRMTITLSEKYEILSKESAYSSEEQYINLTKSSIISNSFIIGVTLGMVIAGIFLPTILIAYFISKAHKKRDSENNTSDCT